MARMRYFPPHPKAQRRSLSRSPVFRPEPSSFPRQPSFTTPPAFFDKEAIAAAQLTQLHLATEHVQVKVQPNAVKLPSFAQLVGNLPAVNSSKLPTSSCQSTCESFLTFPPGKAIAETRKAGPSQAPQQLVHRQLRIQRPTVTSAQLESSIKKQRLIQLDPRSIRIAKNLRGSRSMSLLLPHPTLTARYLDEFGEMQPAIASLPTSGFTAQANSVTSRSDPGPDQEAYRVVPHPRKPFVPISKHLQDKAATSVPGRKRCAERQEPVADENAQQVLPSGQPASPLRPVKRIKLIVKAGRQGTIDSHADEPDNQ